MKFRQLLLCLAPWLCTFLSSNCKRLELIHFSVLLTVTVGLFSELLYFTCAFVFGELSNLFSWFTYHQWDWSLREFILFSISFANANQTAFSEFCQISTVQQYLTVDTTNNLVSSIVLYQIECSGLFKNLHFRNDHFYYYIRILLLTHLVKNLFHNLFNLNMCVNLFCFRLVLLKTYLESPPPTRCKLIFGNLCSANRPRPLWRNSHSSHQWWYRANATTSTTIVDRPTVTLGHRLWHPMAGKTASPQVTSSRFFVMTR